MHLFGGKKAKKGKEKKAGAKAKEPPQQQAGLMITTTAAPAVSDRVEIVKAVMADQKKLAEQEAKRKAKKERRKAIGRAISAPFRAIGKAINRAIAALFHAIFVAFTTVISIPITLGRLIIRAAAAFLQGFYKRFGRFSPFGWRKKINQLIIYSGVTKTQDEVTGITIVNGLLLAGLVGAAGYFMLGWGLFGAGLAALFSFAAVWLVAYSLLNLMADKRSDEVENALPDVLQIVSSNISAGMTPYNALWVSARKEFGALAEEIKIAQRETLGGKSFNDALSEMAQRVRSNVLQRTVRLIIQGMKAGGELPNILQGIGSDIRQMRLLQREMAANTMSYMLFILFGMILGAPLLFSVSIQFVDIMNKFQPEGLNTEDMATMGAPSGGGMGFDVMSLGGKCPKDFDSDGMPDAWEKEWHLDPKNGSDGMKINPETGETYKETYDAVAEPLPSGCITSDYLSTFALIALTSIAFFGSILIGLIRDGKQSAGLKLVPLLVPATLGMFMLMNKGMSIFFRAMFGG